MNERTVVRACTEVPPKSEEADLLQSRGRREDAEIGGARKIRTERRLELNSPAHPDPGESRLRWIRQAAGLTPATHGHRDGVCLQLIEGLPGEEGSDYTWVRKRLWTEQGVAAADGATHPRTRERERGREASQRVSGGWEPGVGWSWTGGRRRCEGEKLVGSWASWPKEVSSRKWQRNICNPAL